jgi:hypothetical protein
MYPAPAPNGNGYALSRDLIPTPSERRREGGFPNRIGSDSNVANEGGSPCRLGRDRLWWGGVMRFEDAAVDGRIAQKRTLPGGVADGSIRPYPIARPIRWVCDGFEGVERDGQLLAARLHGAERPGCHAFGEGDEANEQCRRDEHAAVGFAPRVLNALRRFHGVADQRDLLLDEAQFAHKDRTTMEAGRGNRARAQDAALQIARIRPALLVDSLRRPKHLQSSCRASAA